MAGLNELVDKMCEQYTVLPEDEGTLRSQASIKVPIAHAESLQTVAVGLTNSVSTFVAEKSFSNFAIPPFACHWGVVCDFTTGLRVLFHLMYDSKARKVTCDSAFWKSEWDVYNVKRVGTTKYALEQVKEIGK
jgi:hypothetical protein